MATSVDVAARPAGRRDVRSSRWSRWPSPGSRPTRCSHIAAAPDRRHVAAHARTDRDPVAPSGDATTSQTVDRAASRPGTFVDRADARRTPPSSTIPRARAGARAARLADLDGPRAAAGRCAGATSTVPVVRAPSAPTPASASVRVRVSRLADGSVLVIGVSTARSRPSPPAAGARSRRSSPAVALIVAALLGWLLVRVGLRPLRRVEQTALPIAAGGDLDREVPGETEPTEVGRAGHRAQHDARPDPRGVRRARREGARVARLGGTDASLRRRRVPRAAHAARRRDAPTPSCSSAAPAITPTIWTGRCAASASRPTRMGELVEELLLLAHLDEGRPLAARHVSTSSRSSSTRSPPPEPSRPIGRSRCASPTSSRSTGDASRLRQVIDNLLANVRTHTPPGTSTGRARCRRTATWPSITVADDGPGMTAEQAAQVFERFFRADPSRSRRRAEPVSGMAIVRALVAAHHGTSRRTPRRAGELRSRFELPLADLGRRQLGRRLRE